MRLLIVKVFLVAMRILDVVNPSSDLLREWGYDDDCHLIEQDEDLLLHDTSYLPILLEFGADPACPKQDYAVAIAYYYSQLRVLQKDRAQADAISQMAAASPFIRAPLVAAWLADFQWIYDRLVHPRALTNDEAERLAWGLLVGTYCQRGLERTHRRVDGYDEFFCFTTSFRAYLYINTRSGDWHYADYKPLNHIPS